jgi:hypothetical protein
MNTPFWTKDPTILLKRGHINQLFPTSTMTTEEKLNAITRLVIILTILGYIVSQTTRIVITGLVTLGVVIFLYHVKKNNVKVHENKNINRENFSNMQKNCYNVMKEMNNTAPSQKNPLMNVLLTEIHDNPSRNQAFPAYNQTIQKDIDSKTIEMVTNKFDDKNVDERLFKDLGDNFDFDQSMRTFYATPNTKIPNDQTAFADFCYGDMISCKEGDGLACIRDNPRYNKY